MIELFNNPFCTFSDGNRYSVRYEECLAVEAAYQRKKVSKLENELSELKSILKQKEII